MQNWAGRFLVLGTLLLALGLLPVFALPYLFPDLSPLLPALLSVTVAPLGAVALVLGLILFLARLWRRH